MLRCLRTWLHGPLWWEAPIESDFVNVVKESRKSIVIENGSGFMSLLSDGFPRTLTSCVRVEAQIRYGLSNNAFIIVYVLLSRGQGRVLMTKTNREAAQRALDSRLSSLRDADHLRTPHAGWIKAIREALGMTTAQLGRRMGVSQPRIVELERAEVDRNLTLRSLERAAEALGCRLVYALVPHDSLEMRVRRQAEAVAAEHLAAASHSMRLEDQGTSSAVNQREVQRLAAELRSRRLARLWDR